MLPEIIVSLNILIPIVPKPELKVSQGIMLQMATAFFGAFIYLIALFYGISNLGDIFSGNVTYFPTANIYLQATGSTAGAVGLIAVLFIVTFPTLIGVFVTGGRMWWTLARDNALPFSPFFAQVNPKLETPAHATVLMSGIVTLLGCIYVGSTTAFQALVSSFVVLSTLSYVGAIMPHVLTKRKNIVPGPFWMGNFGYAVNIISLIWILVTNVFFMFPFVLPVTVQNMNYTVVITVGIMTIVACWWVVSANKNYRGPIYSMEAARKLMHVHVDTVKEMPAVEELKSQNS